MFDFTALPPEINSTRMYHGAGSFPIFAAVAAWTDLSEDLATAAREVSQTVIDAVPASFAGQTSEEVATRTTPYVAWLNMAAERANLTADQLGVAADAYEAAYRATVSPLTVYVNVVQTKVLKVLNWFGQFSTMIADKEAEYSEMWRHNAAAMVAYRDAVLEAMAKTIEFEPAPKLVSDYARSDSFDSFDPPAAAEATPLCGSRAQHLPPVSNIASMASTGLSMIDGMGPMMSVVPTTAANAAETLTQGEQAIENAVGPLGRGALGSGLEGQVAANLGRAASVGLLRVPETWAAANQKVMPTMHALPLTSNVATAEESWPPPPLEWTSEWEPMASGRDGGIA